MHNATLVQVAQAPRSVVCDVADDPPVHLRRRGCQVLVRQGVLQVALAARKDQAEDVLLKKEFPARLFVENFVVQHADHVLSWEFKLFPREQLPVELVFLTHEFEHDGALFVLSVRGLQDLAGGRLVKGRSQAVAAQEEQAGLHGGAKHWKSRRWKSNTGRAP